MKQRYLCALIALVLFSTHNLWGQDKLTVGTQIYCNSQVPLVNSATLYATASGGTAPYMYQWAGTSGFASSSQNPTVILGGMYTVTVTDARNNTATASQLVVFPYPPPIQIYSSNTLPCNVDSGQTKQVCEKVCPYSTTTYTSSMWVNLNPSTAGTNTKSFWVVNGSTDYAVDQNGVLRVNWGGPGTGSVYTEGYNGGCRATGERCVTIIEPPKAAFRANPAPVGDTIRVCKGQSVFFENQSTQADDYEWRFSDDLSTVTESNPAHPYRAPGLYRVSLIARSACLCSDTLVRYVRVLDVSSPVLDCSGTVCPGAVVKYTAQGACAPYSWTVSPNGILLGGGTAQSDSVTVRWDKGPAGLIGCLANACTGLGCPVPAQLRVPVLDDNAEIEGKTRVCPGSYETYGIEAYGGTSFQWQLTGQGTLVEGQGTDHVSIVWGETANANTTHWLIVEYDNCYLGCKGKDSIAVRILPPFSLQGGVEVCPRMNLGFAARLNPSLQPLSCTWTLVAPNGDTAWVSPTPSASPSVAFLKGSGLYQLLARPANPAQTCIDQRLWAVQVAPETPKPTGIDGPSFICPNQLYTYEALGVSPNAKIRWTYDNGAQRNIQVLGNPFNITWGATQPRRLTLQQLSQDGLSCPSDTLQINIDALASPKVSGDPTVCENATGRYTVGGQSKQSVQWRIIPATAGAIAKGQGTSQVEIFWAQAGGHVVEATVCGGQSVFPVTVLTPPVPQVQHPAELCPGALATVQTIGTFNTYVWKNAKDSVVSTDPRPMLGAGTYHLSVTGVGGCGGNVVFTIAKAPGPTVSLTTVDPTGFCANMGSVTMKALATAGGTYTYTWYKDGALLPHSGNQYTTNQYGNYWVEVSNQYGCATASRPIRIFEFCTGGGGGGSGFNPNHPPACPPGAISFDIIPQSACDLFQFQLKGSSYQPGTANWAFGEQGGLTLGQSTQDNPQFQFPEAGQYLVVLYARLTNGALCTALDSVRVEASAQFSGDPACAGSPTAFKDASTFLPGGGIQQWAWNFGDPGSGAANSSAVREPNHTYAASGNFPVTLTITANSGCTSTRSAATPIPGGTPATFDLPTPRCGTGASAFAITPGTNVVSVDWNFGQPSSGASNDAQGLQTYHQYGTPGTYTVTTQSRNGYGCTASYARNVTIATGTLSGNITPNAPPAICAGQTLTLTAPNGATAWLWSDQTTRTQTFSAQKEGSYSVTLTDANGCTYSPPPVRVEVTPAPDAIIKALLEDENGRIIGTRYPTLTVCQGENVHLRANGSTNYTFSWSTGGNDNDVVFVRDRNNLLPVGVHTYTVTVRETSTGCTAVSSPFVVTVNPSPSGLSVTGTSTCAGKPFQLQYTGPAMPTWQLTWNTGDKGPTLTTKEAGRYHIWAVNEFGCAAKSNDWLVRPGPPIAAVPGGCHRRCKPDTLCMPNQPNVTAWQWFYEGQPIPGATSRNFVAQQNGTYWAEMTDTYGCTAQSDPLSLDLFEGFGNILGQVWADVNSNGLIDAADTLLPNIHVLLAGSGASMLRGQSGQTGEFAFTGVRASDYTVRLNLDSLPANWAEVIGLANISLSGCNVTRECGLLLRPKCQIAPTLKVFSACLRDSIAYNNTFVRAGETRQFQFKGYLGCDSTVTVQVVSLPSSKGNVEARVCPNTMFTYEGTALAVGTSRDFTLKNWQGCDSVVTVRVSALPASKGNFEPRICANTTFTYQGVALSVGDVRDFTLKNWQGCDSVVTVRVSALPASKGNFEPRICANTTFTYQGVLLSVGDVRDFTLKNWQGCDSVVTVRVSALPASKGNFEPRICANTTFTYQGVALAVGDVRDFTLKNWQGCDSVVTVRVSALPASKGNFEPRICANTTFTYQGTVLSVGDVRDFTLKNWQGCDSVVTVRVSALPASKGNVEPRICANTTFTYEGVALSVGDVRDFTLKNWQGCDSVVTVRVSALPASKGNFEPRICANTTFTYEGVALSVGDVRDFTLKNWQGCDSVVTVRVSALPASKGNFEPRICANTTFTYQGTVLSVGDVRDFTLKNWQGCDSVVTVRVSALPASKGSFEPRICANTTFTYQGVALSVGDVRDFTLKNWQGCDSVVTVRVSALPTSKGNFEPRICANTTFTYQGVALSVGDVRDFTLKNWQGCDSVVTVRVSALPASKGSFEPRICANTTFTYQGVALAVGDVRDFTLKNWQGCDSVVTVRVSALPASKGDVMARICPNTTFTYEGVALTVGATRDFTLKNWQGCDSVVTVRVSALPTSKGEVMARICPNSTFTYEGVALTVGAARDFTLKNWQGCDSVVTVRVSALPTAATTLRPTACKGTTYNFNGTPVAAGETRTFRLTASNGCDSMVTVSVGVLPETAFDLSLRPSCAQIPNGSLSAYGMRGGPTPYRYSLDGLAFRDTALFSGLAPGTYTFFVKDSSGCVSRRDTLLAHYAPLTLALDNAILACDSPAVRLKVQVGGDLTGLRLRWWDGSSGIYAYAQTDGPVWVEAQNHCETLRQTAAVTWDNTADNPTWVYVPNVFAPEGTDPFNATFGPTFSNNTQVLAYRFEVFDRWGNLMHRAAQTEDRWDGLFRSEAMRPGVYVWQLDARIWYCGRELDVRRVGDVTVVR